MKKMKSIVVSSALLLSTISNINEFGSTLFDIIFKLLELKLFGGNKK